jgi:hypothetical protein
MRCALISVLLPAFAAVAGVLPARSTAQTPHSRRVPCAEAGAMPAGQVPNGRRVLGSVVVPPAYLPRVVKLPNTPWQYWTKAAMAIRAGSGPVGLTVPAGWREREAIVWGNGPDQFSALRIDRCAAQLGAKWNGFPGGFYLSARSACVPLIVRVGQRTATVYFGIGRRC